MISQRTLAGSLRYPARPAIRKPPILIHISQAQAVGLPETETLLDAGFGPARHNRTAYRLRDAAAPDFALSFIARDAETGALIGSVQCWPLQLRALNNVIVPLTLLGPVVTAAAYQGKGIATSLMNASLASIDAANCPPALLIGDASFYGRFGFSANATAGWIMPGPVDRERLLLRGIADALPALGWVEPSAAIRRVA